ncbi:MAG: hypothetical protein BYD32DRAFT_427596 [Podila humilis]|nr:MAG: hypothetical protein BYD32DRAFT_427596 [Podila humilis]
MKSITTLSIATVLASLAVSVPLDVFKRELFNTAAVVQCAFTYFTYGTLDSTCEHYILIPGLIPSVVFKDVDFDFTVADQWAPMVSSSSIVGTIINLGLTPTVTSIGINIEIIDNDVSVGRIKTLPKEAKAIGTAVTTSFDPIPMPVPEDARSAFSSLLMALVISETRNLRLLGTLDATFKIPVLFGKTPAKTTLTFGLDVTNTFSGFNGLHETSFLSVVSNNMDDVNKKQTLELKVNINSASTFGIKVGDVMFDAAGPTGPIGTVTLKDLELKQGKNLEIAIVVIDLNLPSATDFLTALTKGDTTVTLTGTGSSPANAVTLLAIQAIKVDVVIPKNSFTKAV